MPPMVVLAGAIRWRPWADEWALTGRLAGLALVAGLFVGGYAVIKGELSEKLSLRWSTALGLNAHPPRKLAPQFPQGLNDPRFDFTPKEESDAATLRGDLVGGHEAARPRVGRGGHVHPGPGARCSGCSGADGSRGRAMASGCSWSTRSPSPRSRCGTRTTLGYLSGRHALTLIAVTVPFAASGMLLWVDGFARRWRVAPRAGPSAGGGRSADPGGGRNHRAEQGGASEPVGAPGGGELAPRAMPRATPRCSIPAAGRRSSGGCRVTTTGTSARPCRTSSCNTSSSGPMSWPPRAGARRPCGRCWPMPVSRWPSSRGGATVGGRGSRCTASTPPRSWEGIKP